MVLVNAGPRTIVGDLSSYVPFIRLVATVLDTVLAIEKSHTTQHIQS